MLKIALNLVAQRHVRFGMTALAVALVVFMFVVITSALDGMILTFVGHVERTTADLWVLTPSDQPWGAYMPAAHSEELGRLAGVDSVASVVEVPAYLQWGARDIRVFVSGYDPAELTPVPIIEGDVPGESDAAEVVIDRSLVLAARGLKVGDEVTIAGQRVRVRGVTEGHQLYAAYPVVFMPIGALRPGSGFGSSATGFLLRASEGADLERVKALVRGAVPGKPVYTQEEHMANMLGNFDFARLVVLALQVIVGSIGVLIVGVTVYTSVLERTRELGIIKALGGTSDYLVRLVMLDGLLLCVPGYIVGSALALVAILALPEVVPVRMELEPQLFALAAGVALIVGLLGSSFGAHAAVTTDPLTVIRGK